jgi:hypothetical protein
MAALRKEQVRGFWVSGFRALREKESFSIDNRQSKIGNGTESPIRNGNSTIGVVNEDSALGLPYSTFGSSN